MPMHDMNPPPPPPPPRIHRLQECLHQRCRQANLSMPPILSYCNPLPPHSSLARTPAPMVSPVPIIYASSDVHTKCDFTYCDAGEPSTDRIAECTCPLRGLRPGASLCGQHERRIQMPARYKLHVSTTLNHRRTYAVPGTRHIQQYQVLLARLSRRCRS